MAGLLRNVLLSTSRQSYDSGTKQTGAPVAHLTGVAASIDEDKDQTFLVASQGSLDVYYRAYVDSGTDIAVNDIVTAIVLLSDGTTAWPADWNASAKETWRVVNVRETPSMLLPERQLRIVRMRGSGPSHT